jgi:hypothetical protein
MNFLSDMTNKHIKRNIYNFRVSDIYFRNGLLECAFSLKLVMNIIVKATIFLLKGIICKQ